jgi:hypothetical protein
MIVFDSIPSQTGVAISLDINVKMENFIEKNLAIYSGYDSRIVRCTFLGAAGFVRVISQIAPQKMTQLVSNGSDGNLPIRNDSAATGGDAPAIELRQLLCCLRRRDGLELPLIAPHPHFESLE